MDDSLINVDPTINTPDPIKNLESQFTEKLGAQEQKFNQLYQSQQQLIEAINALSSQKAPEPEETEDFTQLLISNPAEAIKKITEKVKKEVKTEIDQTNARTNEEAAVINQLKSEYPELSDLNDPLTKSALEIYDKMTNRDKQSPLAYEVAVSKAAMKLGVKPRSLRTNHNEDFSLSGKGPRISKQTKVPQATLDFAAKMGLDINDPKVVESLAKRLR